MHLIIALFSDNRGRRHLTGASGHSFNTITRALRSQQAAVRAATLTSQRLATPRRTAWPSAPLGAQTAVSNGGPAVISLTVNPPAGRQAVLFDLVVFFLFLGGGKWTEFIQRFSNLWPLKALYNTAQHSPIHAHIQTPTAVSTMEGESQLVGSSEGEASCSGTPRHSADPPGFRDVAICNSQLSRKFDQSVASS